VVKAGAVYTSVADVPTDAVTEFLNVFAIVYRIYPNAIERARAVPA